MASKNQVCLDTAFWKAINLSGGITLDLYRKCSGRQKVIRCGSVVRSNFDRAVRRKPLVLAAGAGNYGISMDEITGKDDG
jgi:hypothetical protein